jgi:hypothetical protein
MPVSAAPRIDDRLKWFIAGASIDESAAEVTRLVGALAEDLHLARPSYQQVRVLLNAARTGARPPAAVFAFDRAAAGRTASKFLGALYEYPFPGGADWYRRYKRGLL